VSVIETIFIDDQFGSLLHNTTQGRQHHTGAYSSDRHMCKGRCLYTTQGV